MKKQDSDCAFDMNIDSMFDQLKESCYHQAKEDVKLRMKQLETENKELKKQKKTLNEEVNELRSKHSVDNLSTKLFETFKSHMSNLPVEDKWRNIIKLCKILITPTYEVSESDQRSAPLWIILFTMFYNDRTTVLEIMKYFDVPYPEKLNNFKLPCDWNEEELDYFMESMPYNVNCNNCVFEDNLKFWAPTALDTPKDQCGTNRRFYTEIPWQFILQNPLIKKPKYLEQIGKNLFSSYVIQYINFLKLPEYQSLAEEDLLIIINNLDVNNLKSRNLNSFYKFIFEYVELLDEKEHKDILDKFLELLVKEHSYDSYSTDILLRMPVGYLNKWIKSVTPETSVQFILRQGKNILDNKKLEGIYKSVVKALKDSLKYEEKK